MRKLLPILLLLLCLPLAALADTDMTLTPHEKGFDYQITTEKDEWILLIWEGENEGGRITLYDPDQCFEGTVELPHTGAGGKVTVTAQNLKQNRLARQTAKIPQAADYVKPQGNANAAVKSLTLTETPEGFKYSFVAEGSDYMLLYYRSKQQTATFTVYPVNDEGLYEGEVKAPLTYARTQFTVQVRSGKGSQKKEAICRKGYLAPEAPQAQEGRLSGVVVCIDPGHQENGQYVTEPKGPGLSGNVRSKGGMAQGKVTLRKEDIVVLEIGMRLRDELIRQGATVVMTREVQDLYHTNIERCEIAEAAGAHIMLRLHCNNSSNTNKTGIQIYSPLNSDYARAVAEPEGYRQMGELLLNKMKDAVGYERKDATGIVRLNDNYVGNNWAKMACFLVEMGYMSNVTEDLKLATPDYQQMLAEGMADGVYEIALLRGWVTAAPEETTAEE